MKRDLVLDAAKNPGQKVSLLGFVDTRRDHGKIIFFDLRDSSGIIQVVVTPKNNKPYETASKIGSEDVVSVEGEVNPRPEENINPDLPTGKIEVKAEKIDLISPSQALPIPIDDDGYNIDEATRFKYRYLDLRRERLQRNLKLRSTAAKLARGFLDSQNFIEIETPYLSKGTPEGSRDFVVPSRLQKGKFYALAQAPQQYKQLLIIAGFERYYQLARAFRDEDLRADRQFEHTQIDIEMAFVEREDVMRLTEEMVVYITEKLGEKITKKPFPVLTYREAQREYKTDKPNLSKNNKDLSFLWVVDFPLLEKKDDGYTFSHNPFAAPKPEHLKDLEAEKNLERIESLQYDLVCNGQEVGGGSIRISNPKIQRQVFKIMGYSNKEMEEQFGHLLNAYNYGAPPHGGIALGLDRLVAIFAGEDNIREVVAFPVTSGGQTSVMDAPSELAEKELRELGIKTQPTTAKLDKKPQ